MSGALPDWPQLRAHALAGLQQLPLDVQGEAPEAALWRRLAIAAVARRVGVKSTTAKMLPQPAPERSRPCCNAAQALALKSIFDPEGAVLLPEWCVLAAAAGVAPPPMTLPALLDWAGKDAARRAALAPVLGSRELWLAAQRADWRWAVERAAGATHDPAQFERHWLEGTEHERRTAFAVVRRIDPGRARQWLLDGWQDASADLRGGCIALLAEMLAPADEALLERALDDKRKGVREPALELLARLPESAYARRTAAVASLAFLVQPGGMLRRAKIDTAQPKLEPSAGRDGWDASRDWVAADFQTLLQRTPLHHWTGTCGLTPVESFQLIGGLGMPFVQALMRAVAYSGNEDWQKAALAAANADLISKLGAHAGQPPLSLLARIAEPERSRIAERLLPLAEGMPWTNAAGHALPAPWSAGFTRRYVQQARDAVSHLSLLNLFAQTLQLAVLRGDADALAPLLAAAAGQAPPWPADDAQANRWRDVWLDAQRLLDHRRNIHQAFATPTGTP